MTPVPVCSLYVLKEKTEEHHSEKGMSVVVCDKHDANLFLNKKSNTQTDKTI